LRPPRLALAAALVVVSALFAVDTISDRQTILVTVYVLGPLLAAVAAGPRATAAVGLVAIVLGAIRVSVSDEPGAAEDVARMATVVLGSAVAVWVAALRERVRSTAAMLDLTFEHAPVGLALLDTHVRYVRVNDRLAEINGVPAAQHAGRTVGELLPDLPADVQADVEHVARTGAPLSDVHVSGGTPAQPGAERQFTASYWPVRRAGDDELIGVGIVVTEVTDRRAAELALRAQTDRYEALLLAVSEAGEGMVVLERDGRCVFANAAFEQLSGYTFPELAAMDSALGLVVEYDVEDVRRRAVQALESGPVQPRLKRTMRRRDGASIDLELGVVPLEVGDRRQLVVVVRDVTAQRRAEDERERLLARSALLAEASELFDRSLDEQETMRSVAQLCVRATADTCVILLGDERSGLRRVAAAAADAARERELLAALDQRVKESMPAVMDSGEGIATNEAAIVPLVARGRVLGVLAAGFDQLPAGDEHELLALFEDLGRRAALALDSARLYAARDHVARTLQRSLLPAELPYIPGVEVAARFLAAGDGNEVGGDFYDCFATGAGSWALVIGDVCGKGAEAAALTALARYTVRAAALHTHRPCAVLGELNQALLRDRLDYRFCTVLYASLTPRVDRVSVCMAAGGHPLPLVLRAGGEVETVGSPGTLLGIVDVPDLAEESVDLAPGDTLVLFTDGVTEADRGSAPGRLAAFLAGCAGADAAAVAEAVEREALEAQGGHPRDDVAVVAVRVRGGPAGPFAAREPGVATAT
jgi:PAS domain S-box-containing protein